MRVDADSEAQELSVYVDGVHQFDRTLDVEYRWGQSGVVCGNQGARFDDVWLQGVVVPEPLSIAFMGSAFVGVVAWRRRRRKRDA